MDLSSLPPINATLNGLSFLLQVSGYIAIRTGRRSLHRALMLSAVTVSAIFLTSYLYLHAHVGSIPFGGQGAFITTADYQGAAADVALEAGFPRIGLINGRQLVDLLIEHWSDIPPEFRERLGLKPGLVRV